MRDIQNNSAEEEGRENCLGGGLLFSLGGMAGFCILIIIPIWKIPNGFESSPPPLAFDFARGVPIAVVVVLIVGPVGFHDLNAIFIYLP